MGDMWKLAAIATCCLLLAACNRQDGPLEPGSPDHRVSFTSASGSGAELDVWVADSDEERAQGLMGVEQLDEDHGMAFVFDEPSMGFFWMKNTLIPLSIAFVDEQGAIVSVLDMEPCESDSCPSYWSEAPYVLAVEANAGYFERRGIGPGDRARLTERSPDG